jgi:hypothetical protein
MRPTLAVPMADRKPLSAAQSALAAALAPLDGARILGGCDDCDAYQTPVHIGRGAWVLQVFHDGWCPTLRRMRAQADE